MVLDKVSEVSRCWHCVRPAMAGVAALIGAGLSWIGLIHAHAVEWAAAPGVALGYLLFAVVCLAYSLLPSPSTETPVVDEVAV